MSTRLTYAQIAELVRQRADLENSTFVVDGSAASGELYSAIHLAAEQHYHQLSSLRDELFLAVGTITTVAGTVAYNLASSNNPYNVKIIAVRLTVGDYKWPLQPFDATRITTSKNHSWGAGLLPRYRHRQSKSTGDYLEFDPPPAGVHTVTVEYLPEWTKPTTTSETMQLPFPEWVVLDAAIRLAAKEERDASDLVRERELLAQRIQSWAAPTDQNWPKGIADHRANEDTDSDWGMDGW
jgi:hypothetical protein